MAKPITRHLPLGVTMEKWPRGGREFVLYGTHRLGRLFGFFWEFWYPIHMDIFIESWKFTLILSFRRKWGEGSSNGWRLSTLYHFCRCTT
jgi:hypothetical protein